MSATDYIWVGDTWKSLSSPATVTPGLVTGRENLVTGTYKPGPTTTGVLSHISRVKQTGAAVTFSTPGQTIQNVRFERYVVANAANLTFRNCEFVGPSVVPEGTSRGLINCNGPSVKNLKVEDSTFNPQTPSPGVTGIQGQEFKILRCDLSRMNDGADFFKDNCIVEACWIHDLGYYSPSFTNSSNDTHNDCIQIHGGAHHRILGNFLDCMLSTDPDIDYPEQQPGVAISMRPKMVDANGDLIGGNKFYPNLQGNAAVQFNTITSVPYDVHMIGNWLAGGAFTVNMNIETNPAGDLGRIENNVFTNNPRVAGYSFARKSVLSMTYINNTYTDGSPVPMRNA